MCFLLKGFFKGFGQWQLVVGWVFLSNRKGLGSIVWWVSLSYLGESSASIDARSLLNPSSRVFKSTTRADPVRVEHPTKDHCAWQCKWSIPKWAPPAAPPHRAATSKSKVSCNLISNITMKLSNDSEGDNNNVVHSNDKKTKTTTAYKF